MTHHTSPSAARSRRGFNLAKGAAALAFTIAVGLPPPAAAQSAYPDRAMGIYGEGGITLSGGSATSSVTVGALLPWSPHESLRSGPMSLNWDLFASNWRAAQVDGHSNFAQIGAIAVLRYRFGQGASPWFGEAGFGGTVMDRIYHSVDRHFSTSFQFTEVLGGGYSFGEGGRQELSLRMQHFSNADIKRPNPGETFVRVRYAYRF
ncbi:MAG: acyloxyacyl hydrolase [Proteobacteria bacterium]|nr:acyloxyacyl hydrolase [Pseudomonadota bacterium]